MLEQKREQEEYSRNRDAPADDETLLAVTGIANGFPTRMREVQRREPLASEEEGKKEGKNEGKKEEEEEEEDSKEAEADEGEEGDGDAKDDGETKDNRAITKCE